MTKTYTLIASRQGWERPLEGAFELSELEEGSGTGVITLDELGKLMSLPEVREFWRANRRVYLDEPVEAIFIVRGEYVSEKWSTLTVALPERHPEGTTEVEVEEVNLDEFAGNEWDHRSPDPLGVREDRDNLLSRVIYSIEGRCIGRTALHVAKPRRPWDYTDRERGILDWEAVPFSWVSARGRHSDLAWAITGDLTIRTYGWGETRLGVKGVEITAVGEEEEAVHYYGRSLEGYMVDALWDTFARMMIRDLVREPLYLGRSPVQTSRIWTPERFVCWALSKRGKPRWYPGYGEFIKLAGLPH